MNKALVTIFVIYGFIIFGDAEVVAIDNVKVGYNESINATNDPTIDKIKSCLDEINYFIAKTNKTGSYYAFTNKQVKMGTPSCIAPNHVNTLLVFVKLLNVFFKYNINKEEIDGNWKIISNYIFSQDAVKNKENKELLLRNKIDQIISKYTLELFVVAKPEELYPDHPKYPKIGVASLMLNLIRNENIAYFYNLGRDFLGFYHNAVEQKDKELLSTIFLLVQHADEHPRLQQDVLQVMTNIWRNEHKGNTRYIANLTDRVQNKKDRSQIYGTHFQCDKNNVSYFSPPLKYSLNKTELLRLKLDVFSLKEELSKNQKYFCDRKKYNG